MIATKLAQCFAGNELDHTPVAALPKLPELLIRFLARGFGRFFNGSVTSLTSCGSACAVLSKNQFTSSVAKTHLDVVNKKRLCVTHGSPCAYIHL
jgi:hypothetical protein